MPRLFMHQRAWNLRVSWLNFRKLIKIVEKQNNNIVKKEQKSICKRNVKTLKDKNYMQGNYKIVRGNWIFTISDSHELYGDMKME